MKEMRQRLNISINGKNSLIKADKVKIVFGPHHYINITKEDDGITFNIGATHHGVTFDASKVDSELYRAIEELRRLYPNHKQD